MKSGKKYITIFAVLAAIAFSDTAFADQIIVTSGNVNNTLNTSSGGGQNINSPIYPDNNSSSYNESLGCHNEANMAKAGGANEADVQGVYYQCLENKLNIHSY